MDPILLVEDDVSLRDVLLTLLTHEEFEVYAVATAEEAAAALRDRTFACVLADFRLPNENGLWLLKELRTGDEPRATPAATPFVLMTAYGSIEIAVDAMKLGANDFLTKPFEPGQLCQMIRELLVHRRIIGRRSDRKSTFLTRAPATLNLLQKAKKVAAVDTSVLLVGESGTGKELVARYIHDHSPRKDEEFYAVNCGAMPPELLESELFGHVEGAFTGATQARVGLFEFASQGTLFLDEIGEMPPVLQVKLLRALQEREIRPVGGTKQIKVNPRIIAATNVDVLQALDSGRLREDFYYRIAVITLTLPPLRQRPEDIDHLARHFLSYHHSRLAGSGEEPQLHESAYNLLHSYSWPGNARELENVIERALILAGSEIRAEHLGISPNLDFNGLHQTTMSLHAIAEFAARKAEVETISKVLCRTSGNKAEAARVLGVSYKTLLTKVRDYNLS